MFSSIVEAVFHYGKITPDKLCLADDKGSASYKEYSELVGRYATVLTDCGVAKNDRVVIEAAQTVDYLAIELALHLIGAVFVPVENRCAAEKIASFAERVGARAVIVNKAEPAVDCPVFTHAELSEKATGAKISVPDAFPRSTDVSEILFSTGTTGKEKGIVLTHANDIALAENVMYGVEMEKDNVEMIPSPLNHSHGLRRYYANMYNGSSVVLLGSIMDIMRFFKNIDTYGVNSMDLVPSALSVVLKLSKEKLGDYGDRLRYIQLGAAPLIAADKEKVCALLPKTRLYNFYGSTESGCTCIYNFNSKTAKQSCIGKPTHNTQVLVVDDDRREIQSSESVTGLLATRGGMNMLEYLDDAEETEKVLSDGVIYSNDIGYIDEDGEIILLGRRGDVINVGGNKVSPEEIENAAKLMPEVEDCGCIPVPDSSKGQVPKLFVQTAGGADFDSVKIRSFLAQRLEPYKVPAQIVQIDKIPRSYNGKLLRKDLK